VGVWLSSGVRGRVPSGPAEEKARATARVQAVSGVPRLLRSRSIL